MKVVLAVIEIILSLSVTANTFAAEPPATLVLIHGRIHTQDARRSVAQAMALNGNSIIAVGPDEDVRKFSDPGTRIIDLGGRVVIPGIIDAPRLSWPTTTSPCGNRRGHTASCNDIAERDLARSCPRRLK